MPVNSDKVAEFNIEHGIARGVSVSWVTELGNRRFGCVLNPGFDIKRGFVEVQASNGKLLIRYDVLEVRHDIQDPVMADYRETCKR